MMLDLLPPAGIRPADHPPLSLQPGEHVVFVGNGLAAECSIKAI